MLLISTEMRSAWVLVRVLMSKSPMMMPTAEQMPSSDHVWAPARWAAARRAEIVVKSGGVVRDRVDEGGHVHGGHGGGGGGGGGGRRGRVVRGEEILGLGGLAVPEEGRATGVGSVNP